MDTFLKYAKNECRRLRREHEKIVDAASFGPHKELLRIEQESAEARLWLADEMECAAGIVKHAITTAKKLKELGGL